MGERKGQSKYYPPDFDPTRLPAQQRTFSHKVRMMMPMSVQCITCAEFIYTGKKFNATIEPSNEAYLGIKIWRLTVRCPKCAQAICLKTDPQNCDYICDSGATRNFEPWRQYNMETAEMNAEREDAKKDVMKDLEAKQYDAKKEMDALNQLGDLVSMSARRTGVTPDELLSRLLEGDEKVEFTQAEEAEVNRFRELQKAKSAAHSDGKAAPAPAPPPSDADMLADLAGGPAPAGAVAGPILLKKKKKKAPAPDPTVAPATKKPRVALGLGLDYASDDDAAADKHKDGG